MDTLYLFSFSLLVLITLYSVFWSHGSENIKLWYTLILPLFTSILGIYHSNAANIAHVDLADIEHDLRIMNKISFFTKIVENLDDDSLTDKIWVKLSEKNYKPLIQ